MPDEQTLLHDSEDRARIVLGLICGSDGVVALRCDDYRQLVPLRPVAIHIACYRKHGKHYEVSGPDGSLQRKIAPSEWRKLVEN